MADSSTQNTPPVRTIIQARRLTILLAGIALVLAAFRVAINSHAQTNADNGTDILRYRRFGTEDSWTYYDPQSRTEITLPDEITNPEFSQDGRAAFIGRDENVTGVYVFDAQTPDVAPIIISQTDADNYYSDVTWSPDGRYLAFRLWRGENENYHNSLYVWDDKIITNITPDIAPINIVQDPTASSYVLSWSPDGRYLAFTIWSGASNYAGLLYVWDGQTATNIAPEDLPDFVREIDVDWSSDGRLAFTIEYREEEETAVPPEIYVWDGNTTTNLSQNPTGADWGATWSDNGQLAFVSVRDDAEDIYVWDGITFKDGFPDRDSFIHVTRELQLYELGPSRPEPIWTDEGFLGFVVTEERPVSSLYELVLWDVETQEITRQFPVLIYFGGWGRLRNGQQVFSSSANASGRTMRLEVRDTRGRLWLNTIIGGWVWSPTGYLAFCDLDWEDTGHWVLSIWDGQDVQVVLENALGIESRWESGDEWTLCFDG